MRLPPDLRDRSDHSLHDTHAIAPAGNVLDMVADRHAYALDISLVIASIHLLFQRVQVICHLHYFLRQLFFLFV